MHFTNDLAVLYDFMNIHDTVFEAQTHVLLEALNSIRGRNTKEIALLFLVLYKQIVLITK